MTRDEIEALLPFLANDTLAGPERAEVAAAVDADPVLAADLRALRAIRDTMQAEVPDHSPGELGLARLMRDVVVPAALAAPAPVRRTGLWQIAAAVLLAVAVGQAALLLGQSDPEGYSLAGDQAAAAVITVSQGVSEAQMRAALLSAGAAIVSGPSALGLYGIAPIDGVTVDDMAAALVGTGLFDDVQITGGQ